MPSRYDLAVDNENRPDRYAASSLPLAGFLDRGGFGDGLGRALAAGAEGEIAGAGGHQQEGRRRQTGRQGEGAGGESEEASEEPSWAPEARALRDRLRTETAAR